MTAHVKHNSGNNEWYTPLFIIEGVREVFGGTIDLDPASCPVMIVLVNNGTETKDGQRLLRAADAVCFLNGRVRFLDETGVPKYTPLQGQMVLGINVDLARFKDVFNRIGVVLQ